MRGRLFDPKVGRFITPDPFVPRPWDGQSWNPYSYTLNNPLKYVDPSGFDEEANGWDPNGGEPFVDPTYDPRAAHLEVVVYGRKDHSDEPARESKANAGTWDVSTIGEIKPFEAEPRPAPETSAYDPEWRHSPGVQYGIGIGTGIALGHVPLAPIAMDIGVATGAVGNGSKYANVGRALGEMAVGITLLIGGVTGEVLGGLLDVTTLGAVLGVPAAVVSFGLVASGLADLGAGAAELTAAMSQEDGGGSGAQGTSGGTSTTQPAQGSAGGKRAAMPFTRKGKAAIIDQNAAQNGGKTKCVNCGKETVPAQQSRRGVTPPANETQGDHIIPKARGGNGSPDNGQVLCRNCNAKKGARYP